MDKLGRTKMFYEIMLEVFNEHYVDTLFDEMDRLNFFTAPASTKYHGAYNGGLFDHSYEVTRCLLELTNKLGLEWERKGSPYIVGMFHDLCKTDQYMRVDSKYEYRTNLLLTGHGEKSVIMLQQIIPITEEEMLCIRWHMGAYDDKSVWNNLGKAIENYPNVLWTHTADMMASRIKGV